ncbi:MAG: M23 family metallopeptidase [Pseudolabrys sp.]|jgi:hypothetical protein
MRTMTTFALIFSNACLFFVGQVTAQSLMPPPVTGNWRIGQGPPCPNPSNHHCNTPNQLFAYDLIPIDLGGRMINCIGAPIRSPVNGSVIEVLDGIPNGVHGAHPAGNHIVIQAAPSRYLLLAHFSPGTISVAQGATVSAGQVVGACGNTGQSSAPHLHIHMQQQPNPLILGSPGVPIVFQQINIWSPPMGCVLRTNYTPVAGDIICQQP